ncbi:hypothetical protein SLE2022_013000 [Rubroshorea leprosula]
MHRSQSLTKNFCNKILRLDNHGNEIEKFSKQLHRPCDVFINHRGIDTKRTISGLLHNHLYRLGLNPFLDNKNMKPGDRLFDKIDDAVRHCKVGVAVFSPHYCESYFCLLELALMMETRKRVIPIFCDMKPSQLEVKDNGSRTVTELQRFEWALKEARYTVGLTYDTLKGDWSEFLTKATDAVMKNLLEVNGIEEEEYIRIMKLMYMRNPKAYRSISRLNC